MPRQPKAKAPNRDNTVTYPERTAVEFVRPSQTELLDRPLRDFVGTPEAAELLGIRYASAVRAIHNGDLVAYQITKRCWLVLRDSIAAHLETRSPGGRPRNE